MPPLLDVYLVFLPLEARSPRRTAAAALHGEAVLVGRSRRKRGKSFFFFSHSGKGGMEGKLDRQDRTEARSPPSQPGALRAPTYEGGGGKHLKKEKTRKRKNLTVIVRLCVCTHTSSSEENSAQARLKLVEQTFTLKEKRKSSIHTTQCIL